MRTFVFVDSAANGLDSMLGKHIIVCCSRRTYAGILVDVTAETIELESAIIIHEIGSQSEKSLPLPNSSWHIHKNMIESFGVPKT